MGDSGDTYLTLAGNSETINDVRVYVTIPLLGFLLSAYVFMVVINEMQTRLCIDDIAQHMSKTMVLIVLLFRVRLNLDNADWSVDFPILYLVSCQQDLLLLGKNSPSG